MPSAARCVTHSLTNSLVTMTAVGLPRVSSSMPSCTLHDVQLPQSPTAVITTSLPAEICSIISGVAVKEKPRFT
jgi:hypothetical protein